LDETTPSEPVGEAPERQGSPHDRLLQRIRERAFEISNSSEAATPDDDWLRAELEVLAESAEADSIRLTELAEAREAEASALWSAERHVYGHP